MSADIKKLAESLPKKQTESKDALGAALRAVSALSDLVQLLLVEKQLSDVTAKIEDLTGAKIALPKEDGPSFADALAALEEAGTSRMKDGKREFLLHRLTEDFEYQNAQNANEYKTAADTEWLIEVGVAQLAQDRSEATLKGANPVISCWIPEDSIADIRNAQANTGSWGAMGENPHKNHYIVIVESGKYEIYSELKQ